MRLSVRLVPAAVAALLIAGPAGPATVAPLDSAVVGSQQAATSPVMPDISRLGPQVGERVPDFSLPDQHGQPRTRESLNGPNGLVLVFNRSADW